MARTDFLASLLAAGNAPADPALDARDAAAAAHRDAVRTVGICRGVLAAAIATYGYGARSDAAAARLRRAEARLAAAPDPDAA